MTYVLIGVGIVVVVAVALIRRTFRNPHALARAGFTDALRKVLEGDRALVTKRARDGEQPIHHAAKFGEIEAMKLLLSLGAEVDARTDQGLTPLHFAATFNELDAARFLVEQGAEVDAKEETGITPLMTARGGGHEAIARFLEEKGADPDAMPALVKVGKGHFVSLVPDDDPMMRHARDRAQAELPTLRTLFAERPNDTIVKFAFKTDRGQVEHLWGNLEELGEETFKAYAKSEPVHHDGDFDKTQVLPLDELEDWQVELESGDIRGAFGLAVMLQRTEEQLGKLPDELAEQRARLVDHAGHLSAFEQTP